MTVAELARRWGISPRRVQILIKQGRIAADWVEGTLRIREPVTDPRKPRGRPRKGDRVMTGAERQRAYAERKSARNAEARRHP